MVVDSGSSVQRFHLCRVVHVFITAIPLYVCIMELTPGQARQLLQDAGADDVSDKAAKELAKTLETYAGYISEEAVALAIDDERDVVRKEDVVEAER